ncbi:N-6 DNA methylase [Phenylobacterium sp.]|uniref:HsdM family class I SAM-dependent methyltransferase n=1 Tax=Phenylobacterium sp. TaxID=1871053 RepID=UPI0030F485A1
MKQRVDLTLSLLSDQQPTKSLVTFARELAAASLEEQHYWIGTFYTLLLSQKIRRQQATYFTPPYLAEAVLDLAISAGFDVRQHRVLDPAAGGAAFLSNIAARASADGVDAKAAVSRLHGIEIDAGLARVSEALVGDRLGLSKAPKLIIVGDALLQRTRELYDLVVANPPYGRVTAADLPDERWKEIAYSGHINKYAVFADLCIRYAKPGGLVALVLPSSFRSGPLYDRMRSYLRSQGQILAIGFVPERKSVFADVQQDISVLLIRKGEPHPAAALVDFPVLSAEADVQAARLPLSAVSGDPWPLPATEADQVGGATLADYGVEARSGYFVWNREGHRLLKRARRTAFPLVWAANVKAGELCRPAGKKNVGTDFVDFKGPSTAIITSSAAVMQRTTNDKQARRLIAAVVAPDVVEKWGGFVTENHTIVLTCESADNLALAVRLLNTAAADERYRRVSGTAAVSVKLLRDLDLPRPAIFREELRSHTGDAEGAARSAYARPSLSGGANE